MSADVGLEVAHIKNSQAASLFADLALMPVIQCHMLGLADLFAGAGKTPKRVFPATVLLDLSSMSVAKFEESQPMATAPCMKSFRHSIQ